MHIGEQYNRNRPFLIVSMTARPNKTAKTRESGWSEKPGAWDVMETPAIIDRVSKKMMTEAAVIIDILNLKVVKNRFGNDEEVVKYYMSKYSADITESLQKWNDELKALTK